jgi:hypothetical protein
MPPALAHLWWLLGTWEGTGLGQYPTIEDFRFGQRVWFSCDGRPFLSYMSKSWLVAEDGSIGRPLATESGFLRPGPEGEGDVELVLSHPTGYAEVWLGRVQINDLQDARVTGAQMELSTEVVARTGSAKEYSAGHRLYGLRNGALLWTFDMAAMGHGLSNHLAARLLPVHEPRATG